MRSAHVRIRFDETVETIKFDFKFQKPKDLRSRILEMAKSSDGTSNESEKNESAVEEESASVADAALAALSELKKERDQTSNEDVSPYCGFQVASIRDEVASRFNLTKASILIFSEATTNRIKYSNDLHDELDKWDAHVADRLHRWHREVLDDAINCLLTPTAKSEDIETSLYTIWSHTNGKILHEYISFDKDFCTGVKIALRSGNINVATSSAAIVWILYHQKIMAHGYGFVSQSQESYIVDALFDCVEHSCEKPDGNSSSTSYYHLVAYALDIISKEIDNAIDLGNVLETSSKSLSNIMQILVRCSCVFKTIDVLVENLALVCVTVLLPRVETWQQLECAKLLLSAAFDDDASHTNSKSAHCGLYALALVCSSNRNTWNELVFKMEEDLDFVQKFVKLAGLPSPAKHLAMDEHISVVFRSIACALAATDKTILLESSQYLDNLCKTAISFTSLSKQDFADNERNRRTATYACTTVSELISTGRIIVDTSLCTKLLRLVRELVPTEISNEAAKALSYCAYFDNDHKQFAISESMIKQIISCVRSRAAYSIEPEVQNYMAKAFFFAVTKRIGHRKVNCVLECNVDVVAVLKVLGERELQGVSIAALDKVLSALWLLLLNEEVRNLAAGNNVIGLLLRTYKHLKQMHLRVTGKLKILSTNKKCLHNQSKGSNFLRDQKRIELAQKQNILHAICIAENRTLGCLFLACYESPAIITPAYLESIGGILNNDEHSISAVTTTLAILHYALTKNVGLCETISSSEEVISQLQAIVLKEDFSNFGRLLALQIFEKSVNKEGFSTRMEQFMKLLIEMTPTCDSEVLQYTCTEIAILAMHEKCSIILKRNKAVRTIAEALSAKMVGNDPLGKNSLPSVVACVVALRNLSIWPLHQVSIIKLALSSLLLVTAAVSEVTLNDNLASLKKNAEDAIYNGIRHPQCGILAYKINLRLQLTKFKYEKEIAVRDALIKKSRSKSVRTKIKEAGGCSPLQPDMNSHDVWQIRRLRLAADSWITSPLSAGKVISNSDENFMERPVSLASRMCKPLAYSLTRSSDMLPKRKSSTNKAKAYRYLNHWEPPIKKIEYVTKGWGNDGKSEKYLQPIGTSSHRPHTAPISSTATKRTLRRTKLSTKGRPGSAPGVAKKTKELTNDQYMTNYQSSSSSSSSSSSLVKSTRGSRPLTAPGSSRISKQKRNNGRQTKSASPHRRRTLERKANPAFSLILEPGNSKFSKIRFGPKANKLANGGSRLMKVARWEGVPGSNVDVPTYLLPDGRRMHYFCKTDLQPPQQCEVSNIMITMFSRSNNFPGLHPALDLKLPYDTHDSGCADERLLKVKENNVTSLVMGLEEPLTSVMISDIFKSREPLEFKNDALPLEVIVKTNKKKRIANYKAPPMHKEWAVRRSIFWSYSENIFDENNAFHVASHIDCKRLFLKADMKALLLENSALGHEEAIHRCSCCIKKNYEPLANSFRILQDVEEYGISRDNCIDLFCNLGFSSDLVRECVTKAEELVPSLKRMLQKFDPFNKHLNRWQFLEICVRLALASKVSTIESKIEQFIEKLAHSILLSKETPGDIFRTEVLYCKEIDKVFRDYKAILKSIFEEYSCEQKKWTHGAWSTFIVTMQLVDLRCTMEVINNIFKSSILFESREIIHRSSMSLMGFFSFIEAICRLAKFKLLPHEEDLLLSDKTADTFLEEKIHNGTLKIWEENEVEKEDSRTTSVKLSVLLKVVQSRYLRKMG